MSNELDYFCPRCSHELDGVSTTKTIGDSYTFTPKLNLHCTNCDWHWRGDEAHSPVKGKVRDEDN